MLWWGFFLTTSTYPGCDTAKSQVQTEGCYRMDVLDCILQDVWGNFAHSSTRNTAGDTFPPFRLFYLGNNVWCHQSRSITVCFRCWHYKPFHIILWKVPVFFVFFFKTALSSTIPDSGSHFLIGTVCSTMLLTESLSSPHSERREANNQLEDPVTPLVPPSHSPLHDTTGYTRSTSLAPTPPDRVNDGALVS